MLQSRRSPILPYPSSSGGVQGTDRRIEPSAAHCLWQTRDGREVNHSLLQNRDKHQVERRIKTGRPPICRTHVAGVEEKPFAVARGTGQRLGPSMRIESLGPGLLHERRGVEILPGDAIQHIVEAVAIGPENTLLGALRCSSIRQHRNLVRIPIVIVRRRELKVPDQFSGRSTKCHGGVRIQVVASSGRCVEDGLRITNAPNEKVELRIVRSRQPCGRASLAPGVTGPRPAARLAGLGDRHEPPSLPSTIRIVGRDEALTARAAPDGDASHDEIAIGQGRTSDRVPLHIGRNRRLPLEGARRCRNGDESGVQRSKEYFVVEDCDATIRQYRGVPRDRAR